MLRKSFFVLALLQILVFTGHGGQSPTPVRLDKGWKFQPGDNPAYALPGFDDSKWGSIQTDRVWEEQGYEKLDGFAWYRLKFVLPSKLKDSAALKDGLRLNLGKINNFDQAYLNGTIFGVNGEVVPASTPIDKAYTKADQALYNVERIYVLPVDDPRIRWDAENSTFLNIARIEAGLGFGWFASEGSMEIEAFSPDAGALDIARNAILATVNGVAAETSAAVEVALKASLPPAIHG